MLACLLCNHREAIVTMALFAAPTIKFAVLQYLFVIDDGRRRILHFNITRYPFRTVATTEPPQVRPAHLSLGDCVAPAETSPQPVSFRPQFLIILEAIA